MSEASPKSRRKYVKIMPIPFGNYCTDDGPMVRHQLVWAELPPNNEGSKRGRWNFPDWLTSIERYEDKTAVFFLSAMNGYDYNIKKLTSGSKFRYPEVDFGASCKKTERKKRDKELLEKVLRVAHLPDDHRLIKSGSKGLQNSYGLTDKYDLNRQIITSVRGYQKSFDETISDKTVFESGYKRVCTASALLNHAKKIFAFGGKISSKMKGQNITLSPRDIEYMNKNIINGIPLLSFADILVATLCSGINFANYVFWLANLWDVFEICAFLGRHKICETTALDAHNEVIYLDYLSKISLMRDVDIRFHYRAKLIEYGTYFLVTMDEISQGMPGEKRSLNSMSINIIEFKDFLFPGLNQSHHSPPQLALQFLHRIGLSE